MLPIHLINKPDAFISTNQAMLFPFSNKKINKTSKTQNKKISKSKFSKDEDKKLIYLVEEYGENAWIFISKKMENRNPRQCRDRWNNYLNPKLNNEKWTHEEDLLLFYKFNEIGPHWRQISLFFRNRSTNSIRNRLIKIINDHKINIKNNLASGILFQNQHEAIPFVNPNNFIITNIQNQPSNNQNNEVSSIFENKIENEKLTSIDTVFTYNQQDEKTFDIFLNDENEDDFDCLFSY